MTIDSLIRDAAKTLGQAGVPTPRLDAELIAAHCLGANRQGLFLRRRETPTDEQAQCIDRLVRRRANREPIHYILGHREFWSIDLAVNEAVMVPRPETETLVQAAVDFLAARKPPAGTDSAPRPIILDIGTGSGAIAIALAKELGGRCRVVATDISTCALKVARKNVQNTSLDAAISLVCCDVAEALSPVRLGEKVDVIVSNPPYIPTQAIRDLTPEVARFEPKVALDGGPDGLSFYPRLMEAASDVLARGGALLCELDPEMPQQIVAIWQGFSEALGKPVFRKDLAGRPRVAVFHRL